MRSAGRTRGATAGTVAEHCYAGREARLGSSDDVWSLIDRSGRKLRRSQYHVGVEYGRTVLRADRMVRNTPGSAGERERRHRQSSVDASVVLSGADVMGPIRLPRLLPAGFIRVGEPDDAAAVRRVRAIVLMMS